MNSEQMNSFEIVFSIEDIDKLNNDEFVHQLSLDINQMILTNFEALVQLLYRIDVSEIKLKTLLKENPDQDAGKIIALLMIERQIQKLKFKKESSQATDIQVNKTNEERW